jgi:hypothetical protein
MSCGSNADNSSTNNQAPTPANTTQGPNPIITEATELAKLVDLDTSQINIASYLGDGRLQYVLTGSNAQLTIILSDLSQITHEVAT